MGRESFGVVGFDLCAPTSMSSKDSQLKSAYNSLIIGPRGLGW